MTNINTSRRQYLVRVTAVFIFIFFFDMLLNGKVLAGVYQQTASMWRAPEDAMKLLPLCIIIHLGIACVITSLYSRYVHFDHMPMENGVDRKATEEKLMPRTQSLFFGMSIGLLLALPIGLAFVSMPLPANLVVAWVIGALLKGIIVGFILYYVKMQKEII